MSDPENRAENFLKRWSRRKQTAKTRPRAGSGSPQSANAEARPSPGTITQSDPDLVAFDPVTLPPIESITATSDIRAFLAPSVPEELSRAALRRAWVTDPAIRDFVGLAENQWDFTKPDAVPGFGSLERTPELRRIVARLVGEPTEQPPAGGDRDKPIAEASAKLPPPRVVAPAVGAANAAPEPSEPPLVLRPNKNDAATQTECGETAMTPGSPHRRHGGALPK